MDQINIGLDGKNDQAAQPKPFITDKRFWLIYFLPCFSLSTLLGVVYTYVVVKKQYASTVEVSFSKVEDPNVYYSVDNLFLSDESAQNSQAKLATNGTVHSDGSQISFGEIKKGLSDYFTVSLPDFRWSFVSSDKAICVAVINQHAQITVDLFNQKFPNYANQLTLSSLSTEAVDTNSFKFLYLTVFPVLGIVISVAAYQFGKRRVSR